MKPLLLTMAGVLLLIAAPSVSTAGEIPTCLDVPGPIKVGDDPTGDCPAPLAGLVYDAPFELWGILPPVMLALDASHVSSSRDDSVFVNNVLIGILAAGSHDCDNYDTHFAADITSYVSLGPNTVSVRAGTDGSSYDNFWFRDLVVSGCRMTELRMVALNDIEQAMGADEVRTIDWLGDGETVPVGPLGPGFLTVEAMTTVPLQPGLGIPAGFERLLAADDGWLVEIDQVTGAASPIGPIGFPDVDGLAFDPDSYGLYGVTYSTNELVRIDPFSGAGVLVAGDVVPGRHLNDLAFRPTDGALFVLTETQNEWRVYHIDKTTGAKLDRWILEGASSLESLLWSEDGNTLYSAAERDGSKDLVTIELTAGDAGIVSFVGATPSGAADIEALAWLHAPIDPTDGAYRFLAPDPTAVTPLPVAAGDERFRPSPNPFTESTRLTYAVPDGARLPVQVAVYDVSGRRIRGLLETTSSAGRYAVTWDGRTDEGRRVAGGVYFLRVVVGREASTERVVRLR